MRENRRHERFPITVEVEVMIPGFWKTRRRMLRTRDMSDSGVFLECEGSSCPPVNTRVQVRVIRPGDGEMLPRVKARVVRVDRDGMAVTFTSD